MGATAFQFRPKSAIPLIDVDADGALRAFHLAGRAQGDQPDGAQTRLEAHDVIVKASRSKGATASVDTCRCCPRATR